jgi:aminopeptidase YwaD
LPVATRARLLCVALSLIPASLWSQSSQPAPPLVCAECIRKDLEYLAGPELHGRGSGTVDEENAAEYIARQLKAYGLAPAAGGTYYVQTATIKTRKVTSPPLLTFDRNSGAATEHVTWTQGKELAMFSLWEPDLSGPLQKVDLTAPQASPAAVKPGSALLLKLDATADMHKLEPVLAAYGRSKAAFIMVPVPADGEARFKQLAKRGPRIDQRLGEDAHRPDGLLLTAIAAQQLWAEPEGAVVRLRTGVSPWQEVHTWNVLAKLEGAKNPQQIVLLSAHLDHLGQQNGSTYPGADDDASGTVAVMELARALAQEPRPERTVVFALWGSEEVGLVGARYFLKRPTFNLHDVIANLEFEMIGRADPKVKRDELWLTGWERSDLGPTLAAHGAQLVGDPHPEQNFFARSDNFALAKDGIVAQTVSSFGLHADYHQPTDTPEKIDWQHLDSAIGSMIAPVTWLANSDFIPKWSAAGKP